MGRFEHGPLLKHRAGSAGGGALCAASPQAVGDTDIGILDQAYQPPALTDPAVRRRPPAAGAAA